MSLFNQLQNKLKPGGLKPTTTKTTFPDGSVQYTSGSCEKESTSVKQTGEKTFGFVVDLKPDLTVGQVTPWLFVSSQDVPCDVNILTQFGITHVLSLLPGFILPPEVNNILDGHLILDFYDEDNFNLMEGEEISQAIEFINQTRIKGNGRVLVHCNAGISRAPSVVITYLIKAEKLSFDEAWAKVKAARPAMRPNEGFVKQLRDIGKST